MNSLDASAAARGGSGSARAPAQAGSEEFLSRRKACVFSLKSAICCFLVNTNWRWDAPTGAALAHGSASPQEWPLQERKGLSWMPTAKFNSELFGSASAGHVQPHGSHIPDGIGSSPPPTRSSHLPPSPKAKPSPPEEQSKPTWGHKERSWSPPKRTPKLCQGGSAKDGFPGKIRPSHGLESRLPANVSVPHLLL